MHTKSKLTSLGLSLLGCCSLALAATAALADGAHFNDGPVVNVAAIRTVDGHFDEYMQWLATTFKKEQETAKKAGLILGYHVYVAEPHGPNDPDIYLVIEYKNWAAFDGLGGKLDALSAQVEGSLDKANQGQSARGKIRTVLGSQTIQEAVLK
jgi:hypothetical protein